METSNVKFVQCSVVLVTNLADLVTLLVHIIISVRQVLDANDLYIQ